MRDPLSYPGPAAPRSAVLHHGRLYALETPPARVPPGTWQVHAPAGPIALEDYLARAGAAGLGDRTPVLAVGSNANPAQIAEKLGSPSAPVPLTQVIVTGADIAHSAHVSRYGYIAFTPVRDPASGRQPMWVTWFDTEQLAAVDGTECNYRLTPLPAGGAAELRNGAPLPAVSMYRSRWGALSLIPGATTPRMSQPQLYERLTRIPWFRALTGVTGPQRIVARLAADEALRDKVREGFAEHGMVRDDGLHP